MLTLFTIPKDFAGHNKIIQENAIGSWAKMTPPCEILIFGNAKGAADIAFRTGARHFSSVATNEFGTPLLNDVFSEAERISRQAFLCYVNTDILLFDDLQQAIQQIAALHRLFLLVGQRWDYVINDPIDFSPEWKTNLRQLVQAKGVLHSEGGIDYFVYPRGLFSDIPPFAVGRTAWDNWMIYHVRSKRVPVVDATGEVLAIHQNHDYSHHAQGADGVWKGPEAIHNQGLASAMPDPFTLRDATHIMTATSTKRAWDRWHVRRWIDTAGLFRPFLRIPLRIVSIILHASYPLRRRLGATLSVPGGHDRFWRSRTPQ